VKEEEGNVVMECCWARWSGKVKLLLSAGQGGKAKHVYGSGANEGK
jgi:hypothetical protein